MDYPDILCDHDSGIDDSCLGTQPSVPTQKVTKVCTTPELVRLVAQVGL
jgi:hypothetical protein